MFANERYGSRTPNQREHRVIELVAQGLKNRDVADAIGTTEHVVKNYLRVIYDKLGLWNRVELALWYESRRQGPATLRVVSSHFLIKSPGVCRVSCIPLSAAKCLQMAQSFSGPFRALFRSNIEQHTRLIAILRHAIAPKIQVRQNQRRRPISLRYSVPQQR